MVKFFKSVVEEMRLVTWPTAKQNRHDTAIVIVSSIVFAAYLGLLDLLLTNITQIVM